MSTTEDRSSDASGTAAAWSVDTKLEVVVIPVSDVDRAKSSTAASGGGSTPTSRPARASAWSSSPLPARQARSSSARASPRPQPGSVQGMLLIVVRRQGRARRARRARRRGERGVPLATGRASARDGGATRAGGPAPETASYRSLRRSAIRTATAGCSRRSRPACPGASTLPGRRSAQRATWPARCGVRRSPTASTRSASAQADPDWPDWYAAYMVAEQAGTKMPDERRDVTG